MHSYTVAKINGVADLPDSVSAQQLERERLANEMNTRYPGIV
jgi:hypothetical protein